MVLASAAALKTNTTAAAQSTHSNMSYTLRLSHQQLHWQMTATTVMAKLKANKHA
jgi:hypothetical protein